MEGKGRPIADDKYYKPGSHYKIDDRTGFKVRAEKTQKEWTGRIVRTESWEPRNAQDFVRGVQDDQSVSEPRPRQTDQFLGPLGTTLTANAAAGTTMLIVASSVRMTTNDKLYVILDDGSTALLTITGVPSTSSILVAPPLPYKASIGNLVTDRTALALANIG